MDKQTGRMTALEIRVIRHARQLMDEAVRDCVRAWNKLDCGSPGPESDHPLNQAWQKAEEAAAWLKDLEEDR